ncbi:MAG: sensor histidine kinase, partial [Gemmatimonadales bacterium]
MARALAWVAVWTVLGLGFTLQLYLAESRFAERPESWWPALRAALPDWYLWGLLGLVVTRLARRLRVDRENWRRYLPVYLGVCLWLAFLHVMLSVGLQGALRVPTGESYPLVPKLVDQFAAVYHWDVVICAAIIAVAHAREYHRDVQAHRLEAAQLGARLAEARLQVLALQLRPHFLFNALNAISELVHEDADAADRMLTRLSELLRGTLEAHGAQEVPLEREIALVDRYLGLEQLRFRDRLAVQIDVADDTRAARVPALILLPLVENAVRHGLVGATGGGAVGV